MFSRVLFKIRSDNWLEGDIQDFMIVELDQAIRAMKTRGATEPDDNPLTLSKSLGPITGNLFLSFCLCGSDCS